MTTTPNHATLADLDRQLHDLRDTLTQYTATAPHRMIPPLKAAGQQLLNAAAALADTALEETE